MSHRVAVAGQYVTDGFQAPTLSIKPYSPIDSDRNREIQQPQKWLFKIPQRKRVQRRQYYKQSAFTYVLRVKAISTISMNSSAMKKRWNTGRLPV